MKLIRNITTNFLIFFISILIGLLLPPFIIDKLGVEAYGLIPLANSLSSYALIIAITINGTIARYLILDVSNNDYTNANKTFNTAFWSLAGILLILSPVLAYLSFNIEDYINLPNEIINEAHWLFFLIFASFIITNITSLLNSSPYINNRLDLINTTVLTNAIVKIGAIILLFHYLSISLINFAYANVIASFCALILSYLFFKNQTPYLTFRIKFFNKKILKEILSMGSWLLISQIGALLFLQMDLLIINKVSGPEEAGMYSVLLPWSTLVRTFAAVIAGVVAPIQLNYYANKKVDEILRVTTSSVKYLGILISLVVAVLCVHSENLLFLWLGNDFVKLHWLFVILISHLGINLSVLPLFPISNAYKKVKIPGVVTIMLGLLNAILAFSFLKYTSLGLYGVALSSLIVLTLKSLAFAAPYTAYILGLKKTYFIKSMIPAVFVFASVYLFGLAINTMYSINSWAELITSIITCSIFSLAGIYIIMLNREEKLFISIYLKKYIQRIAVKNG